VVLDGSLAPIELHAHEGAEIVIDAGVRVDGGTSIEARQRVHLGARVRIGAFCKILDNHYHRPQSAHRRDVPMSSPVAVEEDVVIGARVLLLPGSHVGRGCVVGPGTVVTRRIPDFSHVAGFPATVRREVARGSS
jgi:acetyltransferase-like isoleucine patch superfamily enzyme